MIGVQAEGAAPLYYTWKYNLNELKVIENPETIASAIRIGKPVNWFKALKAIRESRGLIVTVSDSEILKAQKLLGEEGIAVEPASATTLAAYLKLIEDKVIDKNDLVVLIATGHGLKDPDVVNLHQYVKFRVENYEDFEKVIKQLVK